MASRPSPHALIVPSPGQGHVNGAVLLAHSLSSVGFSISLVLFSSSYSQLERKNHVPSLHNPSIRLHVLPDGLDPDKLHVLTSTPEMHQGLQQLVDKLNRDDPVTCIISDSFVPWTQDVADKCGLPRIDYWTSNALSYLMISNMGLLHAKGILPAKGSRTSWKSEFPQIVDCIPGLPPFPVDLYARELRFAELSNPFIQHFVSVGDCAKRAERLLIHTVQELETTALAAFGKVGIPAHPIGPLLHHSSSQEGGAPTDEECLKWLDTQADSSVIYVAFGSIACLSAEEVKELALGLEASEQPFLWVLRVDAGKDGLNAVRDSVLSDVLPKGFLERIEGRGKIVDWAPQVKVLKHSAVGGFLTHCGWNSTMESIWEGVALLGCPRIAEQNANACYIAQDWKMGIELERTENGGLDKRDVERGVRALMQGEEGRKAKCRAQELKQVARKACEEGGVSLANLRKFYHDMRLRITSPKV